MIVVVLVLVALIVLAKVLVWASAVIEMLVGVFIIDVREIIVVIAMLNEVEIFVANVATVLGFVTPASYSLDGLSSVVVGALIDALAHVLAGVIINAALGIGVEVMADVNVNVCAASMTALVEFPMLTTLEEFSSWVAFDCWPLAVLYCNNVLQPWMPSYHV